MTGPLEGLVACRTTYRVVTFVPLEGGGGGPMGWRVPEVGGAGGAIL